MLSLLVYSVWKCADLWVRRRRLAREHRPLIDVFIAWNAMYFSAATFEGIMLGRSAPAQVMMMIVAGIGVWLTEQAGAMRVDAYAEHEHDDSAVEEFVPLPSAEPAHLTYGGGQPA
jgi:hypothetical protein